MTTGSRRYPSQIDCVWIAADSTGQVAAFITAGEGPIPIDAFRSDLMDIPGIEAKLVELPTVSKVHLLGTVPRPDSYLELAGRGFHVFDWTFKYRVADAKFGSYQLVATPETPTNLGALPAELASAAAAIQFTASGFAEVRHIDVRHQMACLEAPGPRWVKVYKAIIRTVDPDKPGERVSILAENLDEAKRQLEEEYGKGNVFSLYNEEDAERPR
ncbi:hypothetical protein [Mesorhizobium comanense]|uniref:hypothetical protein n=1 Tax=Mesorhizobium comanense TaxID=2502215 RepID=UPI0010F7DA4B|nr:hypothetical protein [Mesorhizobium comanense]